VRPALAEPGVTALVPIPGDASMPSGHAATAAAAAGVVALLYPRLRLPLVARVAAIGLSRVHRGVHYPSDVLAGLALGARRGVAGRRRGAPRRPRAPPGWRRDRGRGGMSVEGAAVLVAGAIEDAAQTEVSSQA
jgi:undecaprenyl-diphosphatase